jgi:hypothetical protein
MLGGLRATRRVMSSAGGVPLVEPPAHLEERIFAAAREAQKVVPINKRIARAISTAGSWAMRPQTAMAAVFLLMIGSSVVFLRGSKRAMSPQSMTVTAEGAPVSSTEQLAKNEPIDTQTASAAHGYKKVAPPEPAAAPAAAASVAVAPTATSAADDKSGFMDNLTGGQGRGDKGGALGQMNDGDDEKQKLAQGMGRTRAAGPSNAGAIGGASNYAGGGGSGAGYPGQAAASPPPPSAPADVPPKRSSTIVADRAPASPPAKPAAAMPADPYAAPAGGAQAAAESKEDRGKKEKERDTSVLDAARAQYTNKNYADATRQFDQITANGGDASAALWAARSVRDGNGCSAALLRFDSVAGRQAGSAIGNDALLEGGQCYRQLGQFEAARARLVRLLTVPSHAARAQRELDAMSPKASTKPVPRKAPEPSQQQAAPSKGNAF